MKIVIICVSLVSLTLGCSSSPEPPPDPMKEFKKKFRVTKTIRHPLPKFEDTTDNGKLYIIRLNRKSPEHN
jgi:hypothetical protein